MTFLVDEDLPRSVVSTIREFGHAAIDVRDIGLRGSSDAQIAAYAKLHGYCLLTADQGFGNVRQYPPAEYSGLIVLHLPPQATSSVVRQLLRGFLAQTEIMGTLAGKLAIVSFGRVRLR